jgi:hypothetical protein
VVPAVRGWGAWGTTGTGRGQLRAKPFRRPACFEDWENTHAVEGQCGNLIPPPNRQVAHNKAGVLLLDRPGRREAAFTHRETARLQQYLMGSEGSWSRFSAFSVTTPRSRGAIRRNVKFARLRRL